MQILNIALLHRLPWTLLIILTLHKWKWINNRLILIDLICSSLKSVLFLENAGFFTVGSPGEVDLFFSRKIGIAETGQIVPILGGARVSGRVNKTNIGVLSMFTDDVAVNDSVSVQKNNFNVARVNQQIGQRSTIGGTFVSREGVGDISNDFNRVYAIDSKIGIGMKYRYPVFLPDPIHPTVLKTEIPLSFKVDINGMDWK